MSFSNLTAASASDESLVLSSGRLTSLPRDVPAGTVSLHLDDNAIRSVCADETLPSSVKYWSMARNHLTTLPNNMGASGLELVSLGLSHNRIHSLSALLPLTLSSASSSARGSGFASSLLELELSHNALAAEQLACLCGLRALQTLDLAHNSLEGGLAQVRSSTPE